jgi:hypothetical protein
VAAYESFRNTSVEGSSKRDLRLSGRQVKRTWGGETGPTGPTLRTLGGDRCTGSLLQRGSTGGEWTAGSSGQQAGSSGIRG